MKSLSEVILARPRFFGKSSIAPRHQNGAFLLNGGTGREAQQGWNESKHVRFSLMELFNYLQFVRGFKAWIVLALA